MKLKLLNLMNHIYDSYQKIFSLLPSWDTSLFVSWHMYRNMYHITRLFPKSTPTVKRFSKSLFASFAAVGSAGRADWWGWCDVLGGTDLPDSRGAARQELWSRHAPRQTRQAVPDAGAPVREAPVARPQSKSDPPAFPGPSCSRHCCLHILLPDNQEVTENNVISYVSLFAAELWPAALCQRRGGRAADVQPERRPGGFPPPDRRRGQMASASAAGTAPNCLQHSWSSSVYSFYVRVCYSQAITTLLHAHSLSPQLFKNTLLIISIVRNKCH